MVCSKGFENMDVKVLKQVPKFKYLGSIMREDGKNKEDITERIKEAKVMFNNEKQLLCSNNLSLEMKKKLIQSCNWGVAVCGSETRTVGKYEERIIDAFETWSWRRMLKIEWTGRIKTDEDFQRAKGERLLLKIFKK